MGDAPPELAFTIQDVRAVAAAAAPTLAFAVRIEATDGVAIRGLGLNVLLRIAAERRRYGSQESDRMRELFGAVEDWSRSLGPLRWAKLAVNVPAFAHSTVVEIDVPCTYDFDVAAAKYLAALEDGEVPVELLFSGTLLYTGAGGRLQSAMIPWDREASVRMPISVWRDALDRAFPDTAWLRVSREVFSRLQAYRSGRGLTSWDDALESLLDREEE